MIRKTVICCFLIVVTLQVTSKNCTSQNLNGIASGVYTITTSKDLSQNSYAVPLSGFNLGSSNVSVFSAIAIAGFQSPSMQKFYSLVVSNVSFTNGNTQMNFTVKYFYNANGTIQKTVWNTIKLSWLAASTQFQTVVSGDALSGNYLWAGTADVYAPFSDASGAVLDNSTFVPQTQDMKDSAACGFINNSTNPHFDLFCNGQTNTRFLTHSYIMGFQFEASSTYTLAVSALQGSGADTLADRDEALQTTSFAYGDPEAAEQLALTGPKIIIQGFGEQLKYIKIAFVVTVVLDFTIFPKTLAAFQYSGVYMKYSQFNQPQKIISHYNDRIDGKQNYNYFTLMTSSYQIYGLSAFQIAGISSNTTLINFGIFFQSIDSVIFQTNNPTQMSNIFIVKDSWNSVNNKCYASIQMIYNNNTQQQIQTTVPPINATEQNIVAKNQQGNNTSFIYQYSAAPIGTAQVPLSDSVTFTNTLILNVTKGLSSSIKLTITNFNNEVDTLGFSAENTIEYKLLVEENQIISQSKTTGVASGNINDIWNDTSTIVFNTSNPNVTIFITTPRDQTNKLLFQSNLVIYQTNEDIFYTCAFNLTYNVSSTQCEGCPKNCSACSQYICSNCSEGYFYLFSYDSLVRCLQCPSTCLTCTSSLNCTSCSNGYNLQNYSCVPTASNTASQSHGSPLGIIIPAIIAIVVVILIIAIIVWKRRKGLETPQKQVQQMDTVGSRGTMDHITKVQWTKVNEQIFKLDSDCASCRTVPGNSLISCGHNYHLACLSQWFKSNLQCCKCHKTVSGDVTVVCIRCKQYYFKKQLGEVTMLYEEQFQICDQCYRQKLKGSIKRHLEINLVPQQIIIDQ